MKAPKIEDSIIIENNHMENNPECIITDFLFYTKEHLFR
jgi:hypothetical protein